jgi:hypothetical protein
LMVWLSVSPAGRNRLEVRVELFLKKRTWYFGR